MNGRITRLYRALALGFVALIGITTYWQVWAAPSLEARQDNPRLVYRELSIRRGKIISSDGVTLASNTTARANGPGIEWHEHDLTTLDLGRVFDVVLLAGNVPLFTSPGTQRALVAGCARHVDVNGSLITGFQLMRGYELAEYDADCEAAGLTLTDRFSTWSGSPHHSGDAYAVSIHRFVNP